MIKVTIFAKGWIQGVGYRAFVKRTASQLGLKGLVRNLPDGQVEIFCEGPEDKINEFMKKIDVKAKPEDLLSINVAKISCYRESQEGYKPAWRSYIGFEIDHELEGLSPLNERTLEDSEFAKLYFIGFRNELAEFRGNTNTHLTEMSDNFTGFKNELAGFRENTDTNFAEMAEKYGDISKELKEFRKTVKDFLDVFLSEYQKRKTKTKP